MKRLILPLVALLLLAACSAGTPTATDPLPTPTEGSAPPTTVLTTTIPTSTAPIDDWEPVTLSTPLGDLALASRPVRIASLSASATEALFAIGAGDQVIVTDSYSYYPTDAPSDPNLSAWEPNVEAIASTYAPDLVVMDFDPGDVVAAFGALDIPVLLQPAAASFDDAYAQWEQLGAATGHLAEAVALVNRTQDAINTAVASVDRAVEGATFYHELDATFYSVTSITFLGAMYDRFGLVNIADAADTDGWGYPQLSAEYLIEQSPQVIFHTTCCGDDATTISARPGWDTIEAVRTGAIHGLDYDVASRWGPRIADLAQAIADALLAVPVGADA